jgi:hypothetical protein
MLKVHTSYEPLFRKWDTCYWAQVVQFTKSLYRELEIRLDYKDAFALFRAAARTIQASLPRAASNANDRHRTC